MRLNEALASIQKCKIPKLQDHSTLQVITDKDFYYSPPLQSVKADKDSKFILFMAPGAVGKTALAKHIAYTHGGLYWNIAHKPVGNTSFAGEIAHAVGIGNGALQDQLYSNMKRGKSLFVLDSFDEAALISKREGVKDFIIEIGSILADATSPSIILTARTEMSEFIINICQELGVGLTCYNIEYFEESDAPCYIEKYLLFKEIMLVQNQKTAIENYIDQIKMRIGDDSEIRSFIGYAQVLKILSRQIETALKDTPKQLNLHVPENRNSRLIYDIIQELIDREQGKLEQFKNGIRHKYEESGNTKVIDSLYSKQEQLTRLQFFALAEGAIAIDDFTSGNLLLPEDQITYFELLKEWLPQHVFLQSKSIMPIFSDYLLAESLLNPDLEMFAEEYQCEDSPMFKLPTRIFMDCYLCLNADCVNSDHIYYLDLAYSSQATRGNKAFCDIGIEEDSSTGADQERLFLTFINYDNPEDKSLSIKIKRKENDPICLNRAENISINVDGKVILAPRFTQDVVVRQASIECDYLELKSSEIIFETYAEEENHIIVHGDISRLPASKITIKGTQNLKADLPWNTNDQLKRTFYEMLPYQYSFEAGNKNESNCDDREQFVYGLKKVLEQFKIDNYGNDPAKNKDKIDARCHTGVKKRVLAFLKEKEMVYEDGNLYFYNLKRMNEWQVSRSAYIHFDYVQLGRIYDEYSKWYSQQQRLLYI